ncbi:hypothetical protein ElyMa_006635100 [Elysia marginata]|uniref:NR LBD domain-containing protein n=1 Tax=Elysia marginata TaxID=1093978 RepID=A0AAV4IJS7_9GAST|nr:hypothetical protein ElyMa_006635100 [Elysia marginata]
MCVQHLKKNSFTELFEDEVLRLADLEIATEKFLDAVEGFKPSLELYLRNTSELCPLDQLTVARMCLYAIAESVKSPPPSIEQMRCSYLDLGGSVELVLVVVAAAAVVVVVVSSSSSSSIVVAVVVVV